VKSRLINAPIDFPAATQKCVVFATLTASTVEQASTERRFGCRARASSVLAENSRKMTSSTLKPTVHTPNCLFCMRMPGMCFAGRGNRTYQLSQTHPQYLRWDDCYLLLSDALFGEISFGRFLPIELSHR
jgi:hypothetical protein